MDGSYLSLVKKKELIESLLVSVKIRKIVDRCVRKKQASTRLPFKVTFLQPHFFFNEIKPTIKLYFTF